MDEEENLEEPGGPSRDLRSHDGSWKGSRKNSNKSFGTPNRSEVPGLRAGVAQEQASLKRKVAHQCTQGEVSKEGTK